ncbi:hypothetical protein V8C34DRAFT_300853 [Trichoderma compactum]
MESTSNSRSNWTSQDLQTLRDHLIAIAKEAGTIILSANPTPLTTSKKTTADVVTQTDEAVESLLTSHYPSFAFIGEETCHPGQTITNDPTFIVDPIDGTSNFVHGFPDVAVSIAIGFGSDRQGPNFALNLKVFTTLLRTVSDGGRFVNSLRCSGSAAIAICRVAAGQQDAFWECGSWAWDVAAAWCVLVEAGGVMVDGDPGGWNPPVDNRRYLAVRPATAGQKELVEGFWDVIGDDRLTYGPS